MFQVDNAGATLTLSGLIDSGGAGGNLTKTGAGTLVLSGVNSYFGVTTISGGVLSVDLLTIEGVTGGVNSGIGDSPNAAANLILNGGTLRYTGSGATSDRLFTLGAGATAGALDASGTGALNLNNTGAMAFTGGTGTRTLTLTGTNTGANTLAAMIGDNTGATSLTKTGVGTWVLSGANTYGGATLISAGVLNIQNDTALGTIAGATSVTSGAALQLQGGITVGDEALTLNGTGISTDGALRNISGDNRWGGTITLAGTTRINSDAGNLTLTASNSITGTNRNLTLGGAGNGAVNGTITTGTGTLTKDGAGIWTLSGANTYTGATTVSAGVLDIQNNTALGTTASGTTVTSGAAIRIDGSGLNIAEGITDLAGDGGGGGALRNLANNNIWSGAIAIAASGARINSDAGLLTLSGAITENGTSLVLTFGGAGDITVSNTITAGLNDLAVTKDGAGTLTFSGGGANTYDQVTTVNGGTLVLNKTAGVNAIAGALTIGDGTGTDTVQLLAANQIVNTSAVTINSSGVFDLNGNAETIGSLTGSTGASVTLGAATLTLGDANSTAYAGTISGAGGLTKLGAGTLTLSGANSYDGTTLISAGVLNIQNDTALGSTTGGTTVTGGAALQLQGGITVGNEALSLNGTGVGATGALRNISGDNVWQGTTTLLSATRINSDAGSLTFNTAANSITGTNQNLTLGGAGNGTVAGTITTGSGTLTKDGTGTWTLRARTLTRDDDGSAGVLNIQNDTALGTTAAGTTVANGATLQLQGGITVGAETLTSVDPGPPDKMAHWLTLVGRTIMAGC